MRVRLKRTRIPYTSEEKYGFFIEGKLKVPRPKESKKVYNRKKNRIPYCVYIELYR